VISPEAFREAFPAFSDTEKYPGARIRFWLNLAQKMLNQARWGDIYEEGVYLYAAHNLTVESQVMGGAGGNGGGSIGAVTSESESIGDTSFSKTYDTTSYMGAGQLAGTIYGQQYIDLARIVGAGGVQL
jgi:hypothetical protein